MDLLSVKQARSIWLLPFVDLNPGGRSVFSIMPVMIGRYKFLQVPAKFEDLDLAKGVKFAGGTFRTGQQVDISIDLTVYNDGFTADTCSSSHDGDAFLDDLLTWLSNEFDFRPYSEVLRFRYYASELWVKTDKSLNIINPKLKSFASERLTSVFSNVQQTTQFEISGVHFSVDQIKFNVAPFRFERAVNASFSENRYYSSAPLQTSLHLELLNELELILSD